MAAAVVPRPPWPWCLTPGAATYDNQPAFWVTVVCGGARSGAPWRLLLAIYITTCQQLLWVVVMCVLLGKLASEHSPSDHGGRLTSRHLSSLHAESVTSLRPPIWYIMAVRCVAAV